MATKPKIDASGLLKSMTAQIPTMDKSPVQHVQPVKTDKSLNGKTEKHNNGNTALNISEENKTSKTLNNKNTKTAKQEGDKIVTGRPTAKRMDIEYVKISPKIPEFIKIEAGKALLDKKFTSTEGIIIKTLDELVSHALEKLLFSK